MSELAKKQRYGAIDGLRAFSAIGIVLMHVRANGNYEIPGFIYNRLISSFTDLVFLFMIVSGFSVCCGYYEKAVNNQLSWGDFYKKRFAKVWPFFALLCAIDFVLSPSLNSLYEVLANLTLCFGLLPNADISVIGVSWFLGVVFVFYLLFPFICWLLADKKRAWLAFGVALMLNWLCCVRFEAGRRSFAYSAAFFLAGGLIFLYKEQLTRFVRKGKIFVLLGAAVSAAAYYMFSGYAVVYELTMLVLFSLLLIYTLDGQGKYRILDNRFTRFLSGISMEVYLCHMVAFRVLEKLGMTRLFPNSILSYTFTAVGVIAGAVLFSLVAQWGIKKTKTCIKSRCGMTSKIGDTREL